MVEEEQFAQAAREAGKGVSEAERELARAEAIEKRVYAQAMINAEAQGHKTGNAQMRQADVNDEVFNTRLARGVAKGNLAAAKQNSRAVDIDFETWRTQMASLRMERRAYNA